MHIERDGAEARGWFKVVRKSRGLAAAATLLGEHADWAAHEAAELPYLQAEEDRLLYVAATRAREHARRQPLDGQATGPRLGRR